MKNSWKWTLDSNNDNNPSNFSKIVFSLPKMSQNSSSLSSPLSLSYNIYNSRVLGAKMSQMDPKMACYFQKYI